MKGKTSLITVTLALTMSVSVCAKDLKTAPAVSEKFYGSQIGFSVAGSPTKSSLSVTGPNGYKAYKSSEVGTPSIDLYDGGQLADGLYKYEITTATGSDVLVTDDMNNGRGENNSHYARKGVTKSGQFRVVNGQIKQYRAVKEAQSLTAF